MISSGVLGHCLHEGDIRLVRDRQNFLDRKAIVHCKQLGSNLGQRDAAFNFAEVRTHLGKMNTIRVDLVDIPNFQAMTPETHLITDQ